MTRNPLAGRGRASRRGVELRLAAVGLSFFPRSKSLGLSLWQGLGLDHGRIVCEEARKTMASQLHGQIKVDS